MQTKQREDTISIISKWHSKYCCEFLVTCTICQTRLRICWPFVAAVRYPCVLRCEETLTFTGDFSTPNTIVILVWFICSRVWTLVFIESRHDKPYIWENCNDITATSLESLQMILSKGNCPKMIQHEEAITTYFKRWSILNKSSQPHCNITRIY